MYPSDKMAEFEDFMRRIRKDWHFAPNSIEPAESTSRLDDYELRYHWTCCQCQEGPLVLGDGPIDIECSDFPDPCSCNLSICSDCEVKVDLEHGRGKDREIVPSNLLEKLCAEFEMPKEGQQIPNIWFCCKCARGPYGIEEESRTPEVCSTPDYYHDRCEDCVIAKGRSDNDGRISWHMSLPTLKRPSGDTRSKTASTLDTIVVLGAEGGMPDLV
jgi:hypothetical protein